MALPKSVQEQADKANNIQKAIVEGKGQRNAEVSQLKPPAASPAPPEPAEQDWEARFKGLQTKHQTLVDDYRTLKGAYEDLQTQIDELKAKPPEPPQPKESDKPLFSDKEVQEYGEGFLQMVERVARQVADGSPLMSEIGEVKQTVESFVQHQHQTDEERFYAYLDENMSDWEVVNEDENFKAWLAEEMPLTGQQRQHFLAAAHKALDGPKVLSFFASWRNESGAGYTPRTVTTPSTYGEESSESGEVFRQSDIKRFYDEKARGKWRGREKEARQIETKIFEAQKQGRVVAG